MNKFIQCYGKELSTRRFFCGYYVIEQDYVQELWITPTGVNVITIMFSQSYAQNFRDVHKLNQQCVELWINGV